MTEIYEHLLELIRSGQRGVLVTVTEVKGSVPRHTGSKMVVHSDGSIAGTIGGGKLEKEAVEDAVKIMAAPHYAKRNFHLTGDEGMLCGGSVELLFEPVGGADRLIIFGAGHIAQALCPLAKEAGYNVIVVDDRPEYANSNRFPQASQIIVGEYNQSFAGLSFNERTFIVIVTYGHKRDEEVLQHCIRQPFVYLGMIGSKRKTATLFANLQEKGIEREWIAKVHSPIGLKIGAETPHEIAVSILAEMIAVRHHVPVDDLSMKLKK
ncbi:MAG TPA: xanthine dehydrogenase [Bacteroidetes bacterium]|nr:xanthine dehydrogenase [Bacteroidota bacterium]